MADQIGYQPYVKETARHVPLHPSSCHGTLAIHNSWPSAEIRRLWKRSSTVGAFNRARANKMAWWKKFMLDHRLLNKLSRWVPPLLLGMKLPSAKKTQDEEQPIRLVLPFSPGWRTLQSRLASLASQAGPHVQPASGFAPVLQISWKLAGRPLAQLLRNNHRRCLGMAGGSS